MTPAQRKALAARLTELTGRKWWSADSYVSALGVTDGSCLVERLYDVAYLYPGGEYFGVFSGRGWVERLATVVSEKVR